MLQIVDACNDMTKGWKQDLRIRAIDPEAHHRRIKRICLVRLVKREMISVLFLFNVIIFNAKSGRKKERRGLDFLYIIHKFKLNNKETTSALAVKTFLPNPMCPQPYRRNG